MTPLRLRLPAVLLRVRLPACPLLAPSSFLYALLHFTCYLLGRVSYFHYLRQCGTYSFCPKIASCKLQGVPSAFGTRMRGFHWHFLHSVPLDPGASMVSAQPLSVGTEKAHLGSEKWNLFTFFFFLRKWIFLQSPSSVSHILSEPGCSVFTAEMQVHVVGLRTKG